MAQEPTQKNIHTHTSLIGRTIGKGPFELKLVKKIGGGAFGTVFVDERGRAVKVLNEMCRANTTLLARFEQEFDIASKLKHPGIVKYFGFYNDETHTFIVQEYIENACQLNELIADISIEQTMNIMEQGLEALVYAHEQGVIHRDIKPENFLVQKTTDEEGKDKFVLKMTDFGISKILEDDSQSSSDGRLTKTGQFIGTTSYSSPEQARLEPLTVATDLYSFGSTFYELLTAERPFSINETTSGSTPLSPIEIAMLLIPEIGKGKDPPSIRERESCGHISEEIADVIRMLMSGKIEDRLESPQALAMVKEIIKNQQFRYQPLKTEGAKEFKRKISSLEKEVKEREQNGLEMSNTIYKELASNYYELALRTLRENKIPRKIRKSKEELIRLEKKDNEQFTVKEVKRINELRSSLEYLIEKATSRKTTRRYFFKQAADYFQKAGENDGVDLAKKLADNEKRRFGQLVESECRRPPGLLKRMTNHPSFLPVSIVGVAGLALILSLGHAHFSKQTKFNRARNHQAQAEAYLNAGDLLQAKAQATLAQDEYDQLSRNYDKTFITNLESFRADVEKEIRLRNSLAGLENLIKEKKYEEALAVLDRATLILEELPAGPRRKEYEVIVGEHKKKTKDKKADVDDLETICEHLSDLENEIKIKSEELVSEKRFLLQEELDNLLNLINRYYDRLVNEVVEENVNPTRYKEAARGYPACEDLIQKIFAFDAARRQIAEVEKNFQGLEEVLAYLKNDYSAEDGLAKTIKMSEYLLTIRRALKNLKQEIEETQTEDPGLEKEVYSLIVQNLKTAREKIGPILVGFEKKLVEHSKEAETLERQVSDFDELKRWAAAGDKDACLRLGQHYFERGDYTKARDLLIPFAEEEPALVYVSIIGIENAVKDPVNFTYRKTKGGYDTEMLSQFKEAIDSYLETMSGEQKVLGCLRLIQQQTGFGEGKDLINPFGEGHEDWILGREGAKEKVAQHLHGNYQAVAEELGKYEAVLDPKIKQKRVALWAQIGKPVPDSEKK